MATINGMKNLNGLVWAANGEGWYAVEITPLGLVMFYVDADGAHSWELLRSALVLWAVPSHDGRNDCIQTRHTLEQCISCERVSMRVAY